MATKSRSSYILWASPITVSVRYSGEKVARRNGLHRPCRCKHRQGGIPVRLRFVARSLRFRIDRRGCAERRSLPREGVRRVAADEDSMVSCKGQNCGITNGFEAAIEKTLGELNTKHKDEEPIRKPPESLPFIHQERVFG